MEPINRRHQAFRMVKAKANRTLDGYANGSVIPSISRVHYSAPLSKINSPVSRSTKSAIFIFPEKPLPLYFPA